MLMCSGELVAPPPSDATPPESALPPAPPDAPGACTTLPSPSTRMRLGPWACDSAGAFAQTNGTVPNAGAAGGASAASGVGAADDAVSGAVSSASNVPSSGEG